MDTTAQCPPTRTGHETLHTCPTPHTCPCPTWWEDHCHAYEWVKQAKAGDREAYGRLVAYYLPRLEETLNTKFASIRARDEARSVGLEALLLVLSEYDPERCIPLQAYLRTQLQRRIIDLLRKCGVLIRVRPADFFDRLAEIQADNPGMSEAAMIRPLAEATGLTREQVMHRLLVHNAARGNLYASELETVACADLTPEETVLRDEETRAASDRVAELTACLDDADRDLLLAYVTGSAAVRDWAARHGCTLLDANARAQRLLHRVRKKANSLLAY